MAVESTGRVESEHADKSVNCHHRLLLSAYTLSDYNHINNVDIKFRAHDAFLVWPSSGMLKLKDWKAK